MILEAEIFRLPDGRIMASIFSPTVPLSTPFTAGDMTELSSTLAVIVNQINHVVRTTCKHHSK